jgi:hypothetical protein
MTTEQSNSFSDHSLSIGTTNLTRTNLTPEDIWNQILKKLESTINLFRNKNSSKTNTITSVLWILGEDVNVVITEFQKEATFDSYLTEILSIQSSFDKSRDPNSSTTKHLLPPTNSSETIIKRNPKNSQLISNPESDDKDDRSTKKQKLLETDMPWFTESNNSPFNDSDPSCKETCQLFRAYNRDISKARFFIKVAPNSPSGIPPTQWEQILKEDTIDLNQIFASLHHVIPDEERMGHLGDTEMVFGVTESKKWISTASEWSSAWQKALKAIGFAFPHWKEELLEYGDYIKCEFTAKLISSHHKIILYDIVRVSPSRTPVESEWTPAAGT